MSDNSVKRDRTFSSDSLYGSNEWVALRLGLTKDTFFRKRKDLYDEGFPRPDEINGLYLKEDVNSWVNRRRRLSDCDIVHGLQGVRIDAI